MQKIMVVNRGEIAVRVMRSCRDLGISTVAVYSEADKNSLFLEYADDTVCIGPAPSNRSYLNIPAILSAAEQRGVTAIHPGYGFLSENARFAEICERCNIAFIGPTSETIALLGSKEEGRSKADSLGIPLPPGSKGILQNIDEVKSVARKVGFPVIMKAVAGGGGRGLQVVHKEADLEASFHLIQREAEATFGSKDIFLEKFFQKPKHFEVQVIGDGKGKVIHVGDRDCSIQRRNQKILEEGNAPVVPDDVREKIRNDAVRLMESVNYRGVGTVEFVLEDNKHYFLEVNTRIQVEHTVSEEISGIDFVAKQIEIALGEDVHLDQNEVTLTGHALECRINAEDPDSFIPSAGDITRWVQPGGQGVRVDSGYAQGYRVLPHYDSLVAKVITYGKTREAAIRKMSTALREFRIEGIKTNIPLHQRILKDQEFLEGNYTTSYLSRLI